MADLIVGSRLVPKVARNKRIYPGETQTIISTSGGSGGDHDPVTIGTANGLSLANQILSLGLGSASTPGAISAMDWSRFNSKLDPFPGWDRLTLPTANDLQFDDNTNTFYFSSINGGQITASNPAIFYGVIETGISVIKNILTAPIILTYTDTPGLWYISFPYNSVIPVCSQNKPPATDIPLVYFYNDGTGITIRHFNPYPATLPAVALARFQRDGAQIYSGFNIFATKLDSPTIPSSTGVNTCVSLAPGIVLEGNLYYQVNFQSPASNYWTQDLGATTGITTANAGTFKTIYYNSAGILKKTAAIRFPFPNNGTQICYYTATGVLTPVPNQEFICAFLYVTQDWFPGEPVRVYTSPKSFATIAQARAYSWEQLSQDLPGEAIPQQRELFQLIYEYKNNFPSQVYFAALRDYIDIRTNRYSLVPISSATIADVNVAITIPPSGYTSINQQLMNSELAGKIASVIVGTPNFIPKIGADGKTAGDSILYQSGTGIYNGLGFGIEANEVLANGAFRAFDTFTGMYFRDSGQALSFYAGGDHQMFISGSGVGIGIDTPTRHLDINGKLRVRDLTYQTLYDRVLVSDANGNVDYIFKSELSYTLPIASASVLGGIKVGNNLSIDGNGVLSATDFFYTLPIASVSVLGGIKVGNNLSIDGNGILSATSSGVIGSGQAYMHARWNADGTTLSAGQIFDSGSLLAVGFTAPKEKFDIWGTVASGTNSWRMRMGSTSMSTGFIGYNQSGLNEWNFDDQYIGGWLFDFAGDVLNFRYRMNQQSTLSPTIPLKMYNGKIGIALSGSTLPDYTLTIDGYGGVQLLNIQEYNNLTWLWGSDANGIFYKVLKSSLGGSGSYTLMPATTTLLGGIIVGSGLSITPEGVLSASGSSGSGTVTSVGLSVPAGEFTVQNSPITTAGEISIFWKSQQLNYFLGSEDGGVPRFIPLSIYRLEHLNFPSRLVGSRSDGNYLSEIEIGAGLVINGGVISATGGGSYTLPIASPTVLGGIKVGSGLSMAGDGTLSASGGSGSGTVTSVGISMPASEFNVLYSPITTFGTIQISWLSQPATYAFMAPRGIPGGIPRFRAIGIQDLEALSGEKRLIGTQAGDTAVGEISIAHGLTMSTNVLSAKVSQIFSYTTAIPNNTGGWKTIYTTTLPAGSLGTNGDWIDLLFVGQGTATTGSRNVRITIGGVDCGNHETTNTAAIYFRYHLIVLRSGAAAAKTSGDSSLGVPGSAIVRVPGSVSGINWGIDNVINMDVNSNVNAMTGEMAIVTLYKK